MTPESTDGSEMPPGAKGPWAALLLGALCVLALFPLFLGKNFLPFERYPNWATVRALADGQPLTVDRAFLARKAAAPWSVDMDFVALSIFWPQDYYTAQSLREGRLPLWNPYAGDGYPTLDSGQYRPFNPLLIPFYVTPTNWAYCFGLAVGLALGAWGAFTWFRREGHTGVEALLGAAVFSLNPWVLERLCIWDPAAYFMLPWCLLALRGARWNSLPSLARAALPFVLMGHVSQPEPCLVTTAAACGYTLFAGARGGDGEEREAGVLRKLAALAGCGALIAMALAVLWAPLVLFNLHSFTYKRSGLPFLFEYSWKAPLTLASDLFVIPGVAVLVAAAAMAWKRPSRYWLAVIGLSLVVLMPMTGAGTSVKSWVYAKLLVVPLFFFKIAFWAGISFLVPPGAAALMRGPGWVKRVALALGVGLLALDGALFASLPLQATEQTRWPLPAFALLGLGLLFCALLAWKGRATRLGAFSAVLVVLPMALPLSLDHLSWNGLSFQRAEMDDWVSRERPHERVASIGWSPFFVLPPNQGQMVGVRAVELNAAFFANRYFQLFFKPPGLPTLIAYRTLEISRFRQMGASLLLLPNEQKVEGMPLWRRGAGASAYEIPGAKGRLYFPQVAASHREGMDMAGQILGLGQGSDGVAVVEPMGQPAPAQWPTVPTGEGRPSFSRDEAEAVTIDCDAPRAGLLVLRDTWYPGWRATVDGVRVPIYRANGCFRAVVVPKGSHNVRFIYRPWLVYLSGAVSFIATLLLFGLALAVRRRVGARAELSEGVPLPTFP